MLVRDTLAALSLSPGATAEDIWKAYFKLALRWHPNKCADDDAQAEEKFLLIQEAFELLRDRQSNSNEWRHAAAVYNEGR